MALENFTWFFLNNFKKADIRTLKLLNFSIQLYNLFDSTLQLVGPKLVNANQDFKLS